MQAKKAETLLALQAVMTDTPRRCMVIFVQLFLELFLDDTWVALWF